MIFFIEIILQNFTWRYRLSYYWVQFFDFKITVNVIHNALSLWRQKHNSFSYSYIWYGCFNNNWEPKHGNNSRFFKNVSINCARHQCRFIIVSYNSVQHLTNWEVIRIVAFWQLFCPWINQQLFNSFTLSLNFVVKLIKMLKTFWH